MSTRTLSLATAVVSWVVGLLILLISLQRTASERAVSIASDDTARQWYWSQEIGPDHSLYPLLSIRDHLMLATLGTKDQMVYQVNMAKEKLSFIDTLLYEKEDEFALNALVKGHTIMLQTITQCLGEEAKELAMVCDSHVFPQAKLAYQALTASAAAFPPQYQPSVEKLEQQYKSLPLSLE